jgi:hypothetical protein
MEQLESFWSLAPPTTELSNFFNYEEDALTFIYPQSLTLTQISFDLEDLFQLTSDFQGCIPDTVSGYHDSSLSALTSPTSSIFLENNPSYRKSDLSSIGLKINFTS